MILNSSMLGRWFSKLFSFFKKKKKVDDTHIIKTESITEHTVTAVKKKLKTQTGFRSSPYSKKYEKPSDTKHEYKPIDTSFVSEPPPVQIKKVTTIAGSVNFYETVELINTPFVKVETEVVEKVENSPVVVESEPDVNAVMPNEGEIFCMNGYGLRVQVGEETITAYLDTGVDKNIKYNQHVVLYHWDGPYDKKEGTILGGTNTERQGKTDEILIQDV
tara:strand:- start:489 stop:1142 length:654 start_codon:yes stop_codon:yes gene_type:complete